MRAWLESVAGQGWPEKRAIITDSLALTEFMLGRLVGTMCRDVHGLPFSRGCLLHENYSL